MRKSRGSYGLGRVLLVFLAAICLVVVGAGISWAILWDDPPDLLAAARAGGEAAVTQREFDDSQMVTLEATAGLPRSLLAPASGTLTTSSCATGLQVTSGLSVHAVNGVPIVALATAVPLWRDIAVGDSGSDVVALATELARLGRFTGDPSARAGSDLIQAYRQLAVDLGTPSVNLSTTVIPLSQIAWLAADGLQVSACTGLVGSAVEPGQILAEFFTPLASARITMDLAGLAPGARTLTVDGQVIAAGTDGVVSDPAALATLSATTSVMYALNNDSLSAIQGTYVLTEPLAVSVLPPAAIHSTGTGANCVVGDGQTRPVTIIASELGQSFVLFDGSPPSLVSLNPPQDLTCQ